MSLVNEYIYESSTLHRSLFCLATGMQWYRHTSFSGQMTQQPPLKKVPVSCVARDDLVHIYIEAYNDMDWASSWENSQNCCAYTILCGFLLFISLCVPVSCCGDGLVHIYVHISNMDWGKMLWAFRVRKPLSMGSFLMERIFRSTPNRVLTAQTEWLPDVWLRHSIPSVQYT